MPRKGYKQTEEHKRKGSDAMRGKIRSPGHCQNLSIALMGHYVSPETRRKISLANTGKPSGGKGRKLGPLSEEAKRNLSMSLTGKEHPKRWKLNLSKEQIEHLYVELKMPIGKIAESYRVGYYAVFRLFKKYCIPIRSSSEALKGRKVTWGDKISQSEINSEAKHKVKLSKDELYVLYHTLALSPLEISRRCGVCTQTIYTAFHRLGIPIKYEIPLIKLNQDPIFIRKKLMGTIKKPNRPELLLIKMLAENELPYKYVGDGQVIIGGKNPDFMNIDGKKKLIEIFGNYWHRPGPVGTRTSTITYDNSKERIDHFKKYGFQTIVIWENELKDTKKIMSKIREFNLSL